MLKDAKILKDAQRCSGKIPSVISADVSYPDSFVFFRTVASNSIEHSFVCSGREELTFGHQILAEVKHGLRAGKGRDVSVWPLVTRAQQHRAKPRPCGARSIP